MRQTALESARIVIFDRRNQPIAASPIVDVKKCCKNSNAEKKIFSYEKPKYGFAFHPGKTTKRESV